MRSFELEQYLTDGMTLLIKNAVKATLKNPKESAFLASFAASAKRAAKRRHTNEKNGDHVPSYMIASVTDKCNLNCAGCYSRANSSTVCGDELTSDAWNRVFCEAEELGISAILLAGGEPLVRSDVISEAANHPAVLFPVFTNGTLVTGEYFSLFDKHRNIVPILSIEGDEAQTDARRGTGIYKSALVAMEKLASAGILFGASITVTKENLDLVTGEKYISHFAGLGCKAVIFVEYVPVTSREIALSDDDRAYLSQRVDTLRAHEDIIILSFPGDEKESGGCLAAGRGFFHINAKGGAEPCPFSPFSDTNVTISGLLGALRSPLFRRLSESGILLKEHTGGCTLFEQADIVKSLSIN